MQLFRFGLQFGKPALSIDVDSILGNVSNVEFLLELLRRSHQGLACAFQTHLVDGVLVLCASSGKTDVGQDFGCLFEEYEAGIKAVKAVLAPPKGNCVQYRSRGWKESKRI